MKRDLEEVVITSRKDREIKKIIQKRGDFDLVPYEGAKCRVNITEIICCNENGNCPIDKESRYFNPHFDGVILVGDADSFIDMDFDLCMQSMCCGEVCLLTMAYRNIQDRLMKHISCKVEVLEVSNEDLVSDWSWERLYQTSKRHKDCGVQLVKEKRIADAFRRFGKALKLLIAIKSLDPEVLPKQLLGEITQLTVKLYNNLAHCQLHFHEYSAALTLCNKALELEPGSTKALYRRSGAHAGLGRWEPACADIEAVLRADPGDRAAQQRALQLRPRLRQMNESYTAVIKKMFT